MANKRPPQHLLDVEMTPEHEAVLDSARAFYDEHVQREKALVLLALEWVKLNPGEGHILPDGTLIQSTAGLTPEEYVWLQLAEMGCPQVDELTIPIFAQSVGMTEHMTRNLIRESVMLVNFLPRVWHRASAGEIEMWRVRILANECWGLTPAAIEQVDWEMSMPSARHTPHGRAKAIKDARMRHMPGEVAEEETRAEHDRHVNTAFGDGADQGTGFVTARLDEFDTRALEHAIQAGAKAYSDMGCDEPLNVRRAWALGEIARGAQIGSPAESQLPLAPDAPVFLPDCACALGLYPPGRAAPPTETNIYLHLTPDAFIPECERPEVEPWPMAGHGIPTDLDGLKPKNLGIVKPYPEPRVTDPPTTGPHGTAMPSRGLAAVQVEGKGLPPDYIVSSTMVQQWLTRPRYGPKLKINFRPIIDLAEHDDVAAYEVPKRIKERVKIRDKTCIFPYCNRQAIHTDCDHAIPWKADNTGGPTCSCNLAPLCRTHHRAKTHADNHTGSVYTWWNYEALGAGEYLWTGPKGTVIHRTQNGSIEIRGPQPANPKPVSLAKRVIAARKHVTTLAESIIPIDDPRRGPLKVWNPLTKQAEPLGPPPF